MTINSDLLQSKSRFGKNDRPLVIGCASRLLRDKGIPELVEAVKIVEKNCDIELRIAGNIFPKIRPAVLCGI